MAGGLGKKKEQRRAKKEAKKKANASSSSSASSGSPKNSKYLPENEFFDMMFNQFDSIPMLGNVFGGITRNFMRTTVPSFTRRFQDLPCLLGNNLVWLQLLLVDERNATNKKMYALGSRVAFAEEDSDVIERSRKMFQDGVPFLLADSSDWIFTRTLVRREYNGSMDDAALMFADFDPLENLEQLPEVQQSSIAEVFLFFAGSFEVPGDLRNREELLLFLNGLNSEEGIKTLNGFYVTSAQAKATKEKIDELKGKHEAVI